LTFSTVSSLASSFTSSEGSSRPSSASDPVTLIAVTLLLVLIGLCHLPAHNEAAVCSR
jgi:hypothetical protein